MEQIQIYNETSSEERSYLVQQLIKFNHDSTATTIVENMEWRNHAVSRKIVYSV